MTKTKKFIAGGIGILIALFIIFVVLFFFFGLLEYFVNSKLTELVENRFHASIRVGKISGDFFHNLHLQNIVITYDDSVHSYEMARIPSLLAEYDYTNIWEGQFIFKSVYIDSASLVLRKTESGEWLIPQPIERGTGEGDGIDFTLREVGLQGLSIQIQYPDDTLSFNDIMMRAHAEGSNNTYSVDIDALSYQSSDERLSLSSGGGKATLTGKSLIFQDIFIFTDSSSFRLNGYAVLQKRPIVQMGIAADNINLGEVSNFVHAGLKGNVAVNGNLAVEEGIVSGNLLIKGEFMDRYFDSLNAVFSFADNYFSFDTLYGTILKGCGIHAVGDLNVGTHPEQYALIGDIRHFNLNNLVENTFQSDLSGNIELSGIGLRNKTMAIDINTILDESWFDIYHAHNAAGTLHVTTDSIIFGDNFNLSYYDNHFNASGKIEYSGNIDIHGTGSFYYLSAFNDKIFIKSMAGKGTGEASITGNVGNPDLNGTFLSDSLWLYGIYSSAASINFDIKHFTENRYGDATAFLIGGFAYSLPMDSAFLQLDIDSQNVRIADGWYGNQYMELTAHGNLDYESYPQLLTFDSVNVDLFDIPLKNESEIQIVVDSNGFNFDRTRFIRPVGHLGWQGRVNYDETMDLAISGSNIDIAPWIEILNNKSNIGGSLSGDITLKGAFTNPFISFDGILDSLTYEGEYLGVLDADLDYADRKVIIDSVNIKSPAGEYQASGFYPIDLSFDSVVQRFPDEQIDVNIAAKDDSLKLIGLFFRDVDYLNGDFRADLRMTGTPLRPQFYGDASIRNGRLKMYQLVNPFDSVNAFVTMDGWKIQVDSFHAVTYEMNDGHPDFGSVVGKIGMTGTVTINSVDSQYYDLNVSVNNMPAIYELGDIKGRFNALLAVTGQSPPLVSGDVAILKADYKENFAGPNEGWYVMSEIEAESSWDLNINAEFVSNVWVKNDDIDAEIASNGPINMTREQGVYNFIGELEILRGSAYRAGRSFRFEPGGIIFYEDIEYPNPRLDILATTRIRLGQVDQTTGDVQFESHELAVNIGGTLDEPLITAAEGSGFNTEDLATLLLTGTAVENQAGEGFDTQLLERGVYALGDLASSQASRIVGVETIEIDPYIGDKFNPRFTLGKYANQNLYLYGRVGLSREANQEVGFEYRLEKFMLLEGRLNEQNLYNLLLNFYWEY